MMPDDEMMEKMIEQMKVKEGKDETDTKKNGLAGIMDMSKNIFGDTKKYKKILLRWLHTDLIFKLDMYEKLEGRISKDQEKRINILIKNVRELFEDQ